MNLCRTKSDHQRLSSRILVLAVTAFVLAACGEDKAGSEAAAPPPPSVTVAAAVKQEVKRSFEFIGQVSAIDDVLLMARVSGYLEEKVVPDGARVKKDDLLYVIEKAPYVAALVSAKADIANANAEAALKKADVLRDQDLFDKGHVSQAKLEATVAERDKAVAQVDAAEAAKTVAELNLSYTDIKAPFDGRIGRANFSVGDVVGTTTESIARLVRVAPVYVTFSLTEKDYLTAVQAGRINAGGLKAGSQGVEVSLILPNGAKFEENGEIVFVDNLIDSKTGSIALRARFDNANNILVPGAFVTVVIAGEEAVEALTIPQSAIQRDQKGPFVLAINSEEMVEQRYVKLGDAYEVGFEVKEGLQEGERVIVLGLQKVRPGVPVNAVLDGKPVE